MGGAVPWKHEQLADVEQHHHTQQSHGEEMDGVVALQDKLRRGEGEEGGGKEGRGRRGR